MNSPDNFSLEKMKADIESAGNLFYQYRACRRDAAIIYDIENIRHGVVYARTPLQMNDPFDSKIGFSTEKVYEECIDLALDQVDASLDSNLKLIIKNLLKYRIVGETLGFVNALNKLKKYIFNSISIQRQFQLVPLDGFLNDCCFLYFFLIFSAKKFHK